MPIGSMKSCSRISPGWMGGSRLAMEVSSVVVDDLDIGGLRALPAKTHAELVVDANAVLTLAVDAQCFKAVARRDTQAVEASRPVELFELASRDRKSVVWGKSVAVRVDIGGRGIIKKKNSNNTKII